MKNAIASLLNEYSGLKPAIDKHLLQFEGKSDKEMFNEFMFCLLTPQSNAKTCWEAVQLLIKQPSPSVEEVGKILRGRARFHNTKARRIVQARESWGNVKSILEKHEGIELRNALAKEVDGYGLKEAGHFLRNIGRSGNKIAILDRHILKNLVEYGVIKDAKIKGMKSYLELEQQALEFSKKSGIPIDHLDLLFWHKEHGEFFK